MSRGKYSPCLPKNDDRDFTFNCYKQFPTVWNSDVEKAGVVYDEKTMFGNYDSEGFDCYGYSAFNADGSYAGIGSGVDRLGNTEYDYLTMTDEDFEDAVTMVAITKSGR